MMRLSADRLEKFWGKVDKSGPTQPNMNTRCWVWRGSRRTGGYGQFWLGDEGSEGAHRVSWLIHYGPVPPEMLVCHRCDNRACVRPAHLFLGTTQDNTADMIAKGRSPHVRLSDDDVAEIRRILSVQITVSDLARRFGVDRRTIYRIERGLARKGVAAGAPA